MADVRAQIFLDSAEVTVIPGTGETILRVAGNLPTPCHKLQWDVSGPDAENQIFIDLYSLVNPRQACIQMLKPFSEDIPLGSFFGGTYRIWLNGEKAGEFSSS